MDVGIFRYNYLLSKVSLDLKRSLILLLDKISCNSICHFFCQKLRFLCTL